MIESASAPLVKDRSSSPAQRKVIELVNVHKTYHMGDIGVHALRGVTIDVYRGEYVAIMGPSGSGKSTMMNIIGCLDHPTKGTYRIDGLDVASASKAELADIRNQNVGFVFQSFNLVSRTSAIENVELPLIYAGVSARERTERARVALAIVGLTDKERNLPNQLSGGQQQRVAIARALVNNPALILADEPTGALDSRTSIELMAMFKKLNEEKDMTIIMVTHEHDIAEYAKRVIMFRDGKIPKDYAVETRRDPEQVLRDMPLEEDDEEDEQ